MTDTQKRITRWVASAFTSLLFAGLLWTGRIEAMWGVIGIVFAVSTALGVELNEISKSGIDFDGSDGCGG